MRRRQAAGPAAGWARAMPGPSILFLLFWLAALLLPPAPVRAQAQAGNPGSSGNPGNAVGAAVRYRSVGTIYLDAGKDEGVQVGQRLEVLRAGEVIAEIEVVFAAERSASARILSERQPIRQGDRTRLAGGTGSAPTPAPGSTPVTPEAVLGSPPEVSGAAPDEAPASPPAGGLGGLYGSSRSRLSRTRVSGAVSFDWESLSGPGEGRDSERAVARISLRARDLGGSPLQLRLRARSLEVSRERALSGGVPADDSRDRLYEAALIYDEPESRFAFRLGRLGTSPHVGLGYVDGALGEVRLLSGVAVGALYGRRPDVEELGFAGSGTKAGAFVRLGPRREGSPQGFDVLLAGIREESEQELGIGREYVALESRFGSGERWSFFQHAEVDLDASQLGRGPEEDVQLSVASLAALGRVSTRSRVAVSYDYFQRYLTEEDLFTPADFFDRFWRQGLRVSWETDREGGLHLSLGGGLRRREEALVDPRFGVFEAQETYSLNLGVHHPRLPGLGLSAGATVMGYSSASDDGLLVTGRTGRRLAAGHEISLAVGGNLHRGGSEEERVLAWARASLWLELPLGLFGQAEVELLTGDEDVEGRRLRLGLGYRF